jgi:hypothetical protein
VEKFVGLGAALGEQNSDGGNQDSSGPENHAPQLLLKGKIPKAGTAQKSGFHRSLTGTRIAERAEKEGTLNSSIIPRSGRRQSEGRLTNTRAAISPQLGL